MNGHNDKPWSEMTREELLIEQNRVLNKLAEAKAAVDSAKRRAAGAGVYLEPAQFDALEQRRIQMASIARRLAVEISKAKAVRKTASTFESRFVSAARELMDPEFYELVKERAAEASDEA